MNFLISIGLRFMTLIGTIVSIYNLMSAITVGIMIFHTIITFMLLIAYLKWDLLEEKAESLWDKFE